MDFRKFFDTNTFSFLKEGNANWDYYLMGSQDSPAVVVALAKPGTGSTDCFFGKVDSFLRCSAEL